MKKIIYSLSLLTLFGTSAKAQELSINPEVGLTYNGLMQTINGEKRDMSYQFGMRIGAMLDYQFNDHFSLNPGVIFSINSGGNTYGEKYFYSGSNIPSSYHDDRTYHMHYVQVPVYLMFKTNNEYNDGHGIFGIGPTANIAFAGQYEQEYKDVMNGRVSVQNRSYSMPYGDNIRNDRARRFDLWGSVFAGYQTNFGLYFKAQYSIGLLNIAPSGDANNVMRNSSFGLTLGYKFKLRSQNSWE